ncbi:MAG: CinA family protein [Candidatus Cloacimonadales bacterium]
MKFFIDKGSEIYLFQLMKAAGILPEYNEIREAIIGEEVYINGEACANQREILGHGDLVTYKDKKAEIVARGETGKGKKLSEKAETTERIPAIEHGKVNKWAAKPLNLEKRIESKIADVMLKIHNSLLKKGLTLAFAESCTGGMLQELVVRNPGCSAYFLGGITSYADQIKLKILGVKPASLETEGAVSSKIAAEMASGLQHKFGADISAAITGIAGPEGGTEEKPVGTVFTAIIIRGKLIENSFNFSGTRTVIRKKTSLEVLNIISKNL